MGSPDPGPDAAELRDQASRILERDEFRQRSLPRPLRGALRWIGEQLDHLYRPIVRLLEPIVGAGAVPWIVIGVAGLAITLLATRFVRARSRAEIARANRDRLLVDPSRDPRQLEAEADRAVDAGEFGAAIRLRHEAGLIRLVRDGRLDLRPETTARSAARAVGDPVLHHLTDLFEAVVYGDRTATSADAASARDAWRRVLDEPHRHPIRSRGEPAASSTVVAGHPVRHGEPDRGDPRRRDDPPSSSPTRRP